MLTQLQFIIASAIVLQNNRDSTSLSNDHCNDCIWLALVAFSTAVGTQNWQTFLNSYELSRTIDMLERRKVIIAMLVIAAILFVWLRRTSMPKMEKAGQPITATLISHLDTWPNVDSCLVDTCMHLDRCIVDSERLRVYVQPLFGVRDEVGIAHCCLYRRLNDCRMEECLICRCQPNLRRYETPSRRANSQLPIHVAHVL